MSVSDPHLPSIFPVGAPLAPEERLITLDVLRGIALLGVLIANVWFWFSGLFLRMAQFRPELSRLTLDSAAYHFVAMLVHGKAIAVFSFLFGMGFAVQALRAERRGADVAPPYLRRMTVLLGFGAAHGVLLWYGDILAVYALLGFALLLCRRWSDRALLTSAGVLLFAVPIAYTVWSILRGAPAAAPGAAAALTAEHAATLDALRSFEPGRIVAVNLRMIRQIFLGPAAVLIYPPVSALFLLGLWAGRRRIFEQVSTYAAALRRVMTWGLGVGLTAGVVVAASRAGMFGSTAARPWLRVSLEVARLLSVYPLAAGYVAAAVLLLERPAWRDQLSVFAPVGRMALTNYLTQTVICIAIFYGGGLIGRVGVAAALAISLAVFAVQMAWSRWWLTRFNFGPIEWVWRSLTYGRLQPMRIRTPVVAPGLA